MMSFFICGDHGIYVSALPFEQADFCFYVFNLFTKECDKLFEILFFTFEIIFLILIFLFL